MNWFIKYSFFIDNVQTISYGEDRLVLFINGKRYYYNTDGRGLGQQIDFWKREKNPIKKKKNSEKISNLIRNIKQYLVVEKTAASEFGDFFQTKVKKIKKVNPSESKNFQLILYRGFDHFKESDNNSIILSPERSEQKLLWFTHKMINGYDPMEYVSGKGKYLLEYPLNCIKHSKKIEYDDGSFSERIPEEILDKTEPSENCKYYMGIELPDGWMFAYKTEKFIVCDHDLIVQKNMVKENK